MLSWAEPAEEPMAAVPADRAVGHRGRAVRDALEEGHEAGDDDDEWPATSPGEDVEASRVGRGHRRG